MTRKFEPDFEHFKKCLSGSTKNVLGLNEHLSENGFVVENVKRKRTLDVLNR